MIIAILGLGKTGLSLAKYFHSQKHEVYGIDDRPELENPEIKKYCSKLFLDTHKVPIETCDRFFISPGVDPKHPIAKQAEDHKLVLEGELDLAASLCKGTIIAITGTNGKSTTTSLVGAMLQAAGLKVGVGGNLGTPFLDLVTAKENYTHYVIEVSSYQLELTRMFHPNIATLLNLSDDHLDRHKNFHEYLRAKAKIFQNQTSKDIAVYNDDDLYTLEAVENIAAQKLPFSTAKKVAGVYSKNDQTIHWAPESISLSQFTRPKKQLEGLHNLENMAAAIACAKALHLEDNAIQKALDHFKNLPHRLEWVAKVNQVDYYDDSKATNVGAVVMSLASFDKNVVLILGGVDKGGEYAPLIPLLKAKTTAVLIMGEAKAKIKAALDKKVNLIEVQDMKAAVQKAATIAKPGGTVLLSPACSSFDMFKNYHERGESFQKLVKALA